MSSNEPEAIPLFSAEAEMGLVGAVLAESESLYELRGRLKVTPAMLFEPRNARVLEACYALHDAKSPVDLVTVQNWLKDAGHLDLVGGLTGLLQYVDSTPKASHVRHYAEIVRQKAKMRRFVRCCREALSGVYCDPDFAAIMSKSINEFQEIAADELVAERSNLDVLDDRIEQWIEAHERRQKGDLVPLRGLSTPFGRLNELLCGLQPGLHFIAAPPNAGKTCVEGQIAEHVARAHGPVLRIYLDDTHDDAMARTAARIGGVSMSKLQNGFAQAKDIQKIRDEVRPVVEALPMFIREDVETVEKISVLARLYKAKHNIVMLTLDYVQIVDTENEKRTMMERDRLAEVCKALKRLWKELRIPIVVLSQVQRENYKGDSNPRQASMSELFGGAVLEHTASTVSILKMLKEEDIAPQALDKNNYSYKYPVAWHLVKSKHGPKGMIPLWFYPKYFRFEQTPSYQKTMGKHPVMYWMSWEEHIKSLREKGIDYEEQ